MKKILLLVCGFCTLLVLPSARARHGEQAQNEGQYKQLSREIFKQLIEINTTDSVGNVTTAAETMAKRLRDAGFTEKDVVVAGPNERKKNMVARYRGTGKHKPILFIGHLDVVEARREDWTTDPFEFLEKDGFFYGRGTEDMKSGDAILVMNFIRMKKEGFVPDRDLILALTADEEGGDFNGVDWLIKEHRDWIEAEFCVNLDGGEFEKQNSKRLLAGLQASEKVYADFQLESLNAGGHSSVPGPDNAIYHLAGALLRVQSFSFPAKTNEITRNFFEHMATMNSGQTATDLKGVSQPTPDPAAVGRLSATPFFNTLLRTTCVATMLTGGHAPNALPQMARANVNCRIFPGDDPEEVRKTLERVVDDPKVAVRMVPFVTADGKKSFPSPVPPSPLLPEVTRAMEKTLSAKWPAVPLVATMEPGATDGRFLRIAGIPTFGISCVFFELGDNRAHGKDERIGVQDFYDGVEFCNYLIHELAGAKP